MAKQEKSKAELYRAERKARLQKAAKRNKKKPISPETGKRIGKAIGVIVLVALVAVIALFVVNYTGLIEKSTTAVTVGEEKISQAEYGYYYNQGYNMANQYASYGYDIGYDTNKLPDQQEYSGMFGTIEDFPEDQTPMWTDFFAYYAQNSLKQIKSGVAEAKKLGLELDDSDLAEVQSSIDSLKSSASSNGYSLNAYLRASNGKGVNEKLYRQILEEQALYQKLDETKTDELKAAVTAEEVETEYNANTEAYGVVSYRSYAILAEKEEVKPEPAEGEETADAAEETADDRDDADAEPTMEVTEKTMADAKAKADKIAAARSEAEFLAAVAEAAGDKKYATDDSLTLHENQSSETISNSDSELASWLFSDEAVAGATKVTEQANTGYTVYYVTDAVHKPGDSLTYSVRHILVKFPEDKASDDAEAAEDSAEKTEDVVEVPALDKKAYDGVKIVLDVDGETAKDKATYLKAQNILVEYLEGEHTAEAFGKLAKKYSEDSNAEQGGLYEDVPMGQMVSEFESWAANSKRKAGDVGIVETQFGYHVMYFESSKTVPWDDAVREAIAHPQADTYMADLAKDEAFAVTVVSEKALAKVEAAMLKLARNAIRNAARQASSY
ncbi:MAG: peptidylprolyl isomerase [Clostridia bacterium]|nr:peptidylprolyl isomerase [Clostridia bacterium]